jgi:hypothetical protein
MVLDGGGMVHRASPPPHSGAHPVWLGDGGGRRGLLRKRVVDRAQYGAGTGCLLSPIIGPVDRARFCDTFTICWNYPSSPLKPMSFDQTLPVSTSIALAHTSSPRFVTLLLIAA